MTKRSKKQPQAAGQKPETPGRRIWFFRLLLAVGIPMVFLGLLELTLRLAGFGYPPAFLLPAWHDGQKLFVQNNQFGWRFFGAAMARTPAPFAIPQSKAPGTVRIFVFGESAAFGDPEPRFGLPRMLQAMLELRYPGVRFEVINAAMTGIDSNVILPIAHDCAGANGDIWVIYMGNNEVIGPFGAGTVFGSQTPPLLLIHANLALKAMRIGQLIDALSREIKKPLPQKSEWGGMEMFLDQQVRADDPRLNVVYDHFQKNLADIIHAGLRSGAGIVLSTVAVNLKDCAPFASAHRPGLSEADKGKWEEQYRHGIEAQAAGDNQEAAGHYQQAAQIDDSVAELRFRQGWCDLALGQFSGAQDELVAARDLDTLRFRCDSQLNHLIRSTALNLANERVLFADADRAFAGANPDGLPGDDLFYEHVHLTFDGNYLLARTLVPQIEKLLPEPISSGVAATRPWPSKTECAHRLGWSDFDERNSLSDIYTRLLEPPFTRQINHASQIEHFKAMMEKLAPAGQASGIKAAKVICEEAVAMAPDDPSLREQLAVLEQSSGDLEGAVTNAQCAVDMMPSSSDDWMQLGLILVRERQFERAAEAFRQSFQLDTENVWALQNLAQSLLKLDRPEEAEREYRRALAIKPRFGLAWLGLGQVLEQLGRKTEAEECYRKALANRIRQTSELVTLARFCESRGWHEAAATDLDDAVKLSPLDTALYMEAGKNFSAAGRHADAARVFGVAAELVPDSLEAHFLCGLELGWANRPSAAVEQFDQAVRIRPDLIEARMNLGMALVNEGNYSNAFGQFEEVLRRNPTNALALRYDQALREKLSTRQAH